MSVAGFTCSCGIKTDTCYIRYDGMVIRYHCKDCYKTLMNIGRTCCISCDKLFFSKGGYICESCEGPTTDSFVYPNAKASWIFSRDKRHAIYLSRYSELPEVRKWLSKKINPPRLSSRSLPEIKSKLSTEIISPRDRSGSSSQVEGGLR